MYCNQCQQTAKGVACTITGVCGKKPDTAKEQDQLVYQLRLLSRLLNKAEEKGIDCEVYDDFLAEALFATLTNVNFSEKGIRDFQQRAFDYSRDLSDRLGEAPGPLKGTLEELLAMLPESVVGTDVFSTDANVNSAMQIILYGLRGLCAYKTHAARLDCRDKELSRFVRKALLAGSEWDNEVRDLGGWLDLALECGRANFTAMRLLDKGNTDHFGNPEPSKLSTGHKKGKAILMSGHDLLDLEALLKQTEGTGINVYTHGEMLPAHGYPKLKACERLVANFGTAWENQEKEFPHFPGPIIFNTNCLQNPKNYAQRVFTAGATGWPDCPHCYDRDFSEPIAMALEMEGFTDDNPGKEVLTGFGRETLKNAIPAIIDAINKGALKHIFLVGGCDGAFPSRKYYTEFVEKTPPDTLVLTLACGKYRFFDKELGKLGDFPRYIDCGQCNDAYTAIMTAVGLAEALNCNVNDLPLSMNISWYEQKAVAILLTLLALGVRNIILGPTLPAFITPDILKVLVENWGLRLMTTPEEDLKACLASN